MEIIRILTGKFRWPAKAADAQLKAFLQDAFEVTLTYTTRICRDPKDDMLLECSALAHADLLVTGDKDLLILGSYGRTRIVTPRKYVGLPR